LFLLLLYYIKQTFVRLFRVYW